MVEAQSLTLLCVILAIAKITHMTNPQKPREQIGPVGQKTLLLLKAGAALIFTNRPGQQFQIAEAAVKEWRKINRRSLFNAIRQLYQSKMIGYRENPEGTVRVELLENGRKRALQYDLNKIKIQKPAKWDGLWRVVIFDIPESKKKHRDAFSSRLRVMGMHPLQRSVFIHPTNCKNEIDFVAELYDLKPFVRFAVVKEIDIELHLKEIFKLP